MSSPKTEAAFSRWASGYGRIRLGIRGDGAAALDVLVAADRVASAAMWLVVHEVLSAS